jgi:Holliday junction resolvase
MTPEGRVKNLVKKALDAAGVYYFMPVSNGMGVMGVPDIICCVEGRFLAIECKAGKGQTTPLQDRAIELIRRNKGTAFVVRDTPDSFLHLQAVLTELLKGQHGQH